MYSKRINIASSDVKGFRIGAVFGRRFRRFSINSGRFYGECVYRRT